ncbi:hypothetical protein [Pseudomonas sp. McL0111]|uniref:hypothetical protein n=1 Tax=Pseudomonas sp. McL0111 TaxID=3457357 RepID=UPI00403EC88D
MSLSAMIISSEKLTAEDFEEVLQSNGGSVNAGKPFRGTIGEGNSDIWLTLQSKDTFEKFYDSEDLQEWQDLLGGTPQTLIEVDLDHTEPARVMYVKVFLSFANRWPCVLYDVDDAILSFDSVSERPKNLKDGY